MTFDAFDLLYNIKEGQYNDNVIFYQLLSSQMPQEVHTTLMPTRSKGIY
jgi:hypothetical protein